jgi:hypothetical protein
VSILRNAYRTIPSRGSLCGRASPPPEWVKLYDAASRLATKWDIPHFIAEQIIRGVLRGGECFARGKGRGEFELRDISKEIATALAREAGLPGSGMIPWGFTDVELDWNDLLKHGRKLVPTQYEFWVLKANRQKTTEKHFDECRAIEFLTERLKSDPDMKRDDALGACQAAFPALGWRGFKHRVWPRAREAAGLARLASAGRRRKF